MTRISLKTIAEMVHRLRMDGSDGSARELVKPRLIEGKCFVQALTQLPGGAEKFCEDFLKASPGWLRSLPPRCEWDCDWENMDFQYKERFSDRDRERLRAKIKDHEDAGRSNSMHASQLAEYLASWCGAVPNGYSWGGDFAARCPGFLEALGTFMDAYAQAEIAKTADTALRRKVFGELDFARMECVPVPLVADTRHGKTTAAETYCRAWPGRARMVTVPASNRERDLLRAHAEAFGLDFTPSTPTPHLKEWVEFTLRNTGLFLLYDESHYLIPLNYDKGTPPRRLEWVRTEVIDRGVPCAFLATPQSSDETLKRYAEKTKYCLGQWLGRIAPPVVLSDEPSDADYVAVAKLHFPDFSTCVLEELCDVAAQKQCGFKWLEQVGRRARHEARIRSAGRVMLVDARKAAEWAGVGLPASLEQAAIADSSERGFCKAERMPPRCRRDGAAGSLPGTRGRGAVTDIAPLAVPA
jgi:hypothetical protein